jgi:hypothetical protein
MRTSSCKAADKAASRRSVLTGCSFTAKPCGSQPF